MFHGTGAVPHRQRHRKQRPAGTTFTQAFGQALVRELGERDERIVAITAA